METNLVNKINVAFLALLPVFICREMSLTSAMNFNVRTRGLWAIYARSFFFFSFWLVATFLKQIYSIYVSIKFRNRNIIISLVFLIVFHCRINLFYVVDGMWGSWTSWTACSVTCGYGSRERKRVCDNPKPAYNGKSCVGIGYQKRRCHAYYPCPSKLVITIKPSDISVSIVSFLFVLL